VLNAIGRYGAEIFRSITKNSFVFDSFKFQHQIMKVVLCGVFVLLICLQATKCVPLANDVVVTSFTQEILPDSYSFS
jgi:hypothetical protein